MNLFGQELSKREAGLLAATLAVAVVAVLFWLTRTAGASELSPKEIRQALQSDRERLERSLKEAEKRRTQLGIEGFTLPNSETDSPQVHLHIEKTARECGLSFPSLSATAPKKGKGVLTIGFRFTATSQLKNLIKFIDRIQSGEYLICLESWDMTPTGDPKNVRTDLALRAYFEPPKRGVRR